MMNGKLAASIARTSGMFGAAVVFPSSASFVVAILEISSPGIGG